MNKYWVLTVIRNGRFESCIHIGGLINFYKLEKELNRSTYIVWSHEITEEELNLYLNKK